MPCDLLRQFGFGFVRADADRIELRHRLAHAQCDFGVAVTEDGRAKRGVIVNVAFAVGVVEVRPLRTREHEIRLDQPIRAAHTARDVARRAVVDGLRFGHGYPFNYRMWV